MACAPYGGESPNRCVAEFQDDGGLSSEVGINAVATPLRGDEVAQSFKPTSGTLVSEIELGLRRQGNLTGVTLELRLVEDTGGGAPGPVDLATSSLTITTSSGVGNISASSMAFYTFTLSTSVLLDTTKTYWIRLQGNYPQSGSLLIQWAGNTTGTLSGGQAQVETTAANTFTPLAAAGHDLLFRLGCE